MRFDPRQKQWELYGKNRLIHVQTKVKSNDPDPANQSEVTRRILRPLPSQPPRRTGCCGRG